MHQEGKRRLDKAIFSWSHNICFTTYSLKKSIVARYNIQCKIFLYEYTT